MKVIIANIIDDLGEHIRVEVFDFDQSADTVLNYFEAVKSLYGKHIAHRTKTSILFLDGTSINLEIKETINVHNIGDLHDGKIT